MRAAIVAGSVGSEAVKLATAATEAEAEVVAATAYGFGLDLQLAPRDLPIEFHYVTPVAAPVVVGRESRIGPTVAVADDLALVFGMLEGRPPVEAERVIVDPQQPVGLSGDPFDGLEAGERFLLVNRGEAAQLAPGLGPATAARRLCEQYGCTAVVVKAGPRGCVVAADDEVRTVAPHWSERVWPLGSGDCFAGAFAAHVAAGVAPFAAAEAASLATSHYVRTSDIGMPAGAAQPAPVAVNDAMVYLAAPFFTLGERWLVEVCRDGLAPGVFSPLHDVGAGGDEVAKRDIEGLEACRSVLALLDGDDPGTLLEVGWAMARGVPVVGYAQTPNPEGLKMVRGLGGEVLDDLSTALYHAVWQAMDPR